MNEIFLPLVCCTVVSAVQCRHVHLLCIGYLSGVMCLEDIEQKVILYPLRVFGAKSIYMQALQLTDDG